jgi:hypothetical protein
MLSPFPFVRALVAASTSPLPAQLVNRCRGGRLTPQMHGHASRQGEVPWDVREEPLYAPTDTSLNLLPPCLNITTKDLSRLKQGEGLRDPYPRAGLTTRKP